MNMVAIGMILVGSAVVGWMILIKDYIKKGVANKNDVLFSKVLLKVLSTLTISVELSFVVMFEGRLFLTPPTRKAKKPKDKILLNNIKNSLLILL